MKSKAIVLADYRQADFPKVVDVTCPAEHMDSRLRALTRAHGRQETADTIAAGDVVTLALKSEDPRYNRPTIPVTVGKGLLDADLEQALIGRSRGETFAGTIKGVPVEGTVLDARRRVYPQPEDWMAKEYAEAQGMEGVQTVEDFQRRVREEYREEKRSEAIMNGMQACMQYAVLESRWAFDEQEVQQAMRDVSDGQAEWLQRQHGIALDALTEEQCQTYFHCSLAQREKMLQANAEMMLGQVYWMAVQQGRDPADVSPEGITGVSWAFLEDFVSGELQLVDKEAC